MTACAAAARHRALGRSALALAGLLAGGVLPLLWRWLAQD